MTVARDNAVLGPLGIVDFPMRAQPEVEGSGGSRAGDRAYRGVTPLYWLYATGIEITRTVTPPLRTGVWQCRRFITMWS